MLKILTELSQNGKPASIYTNREETNKFHYGYVLAVNESVLAIHTLSADGDSDGILVIPTDFVYRVAIDGLYDQKMKKLCSADLPVPLAGKIDPCNIKESLLQAAVETQQIISVELIHSGYSDIFGFVKAIQNDRCKIREVDDYGFEDGDSYVMLDDITQIRYASEDENRIRRLWEKR